MTTDTPWPLTVAWGDCDAAGIVFYPNYFRWFDAAAHAFFEGRALSHREVQATYGALGLVLVDAHSAFRAPASYGDRLTITTTVTELGTRHLVLSHRVTRGETLICEGQETRVFAVQGPDGRVASAPFPGPVADRLR